MAGEAVLVADDDEAIRHVIRRALMQAGYAVRTTGSMRELWQWIETGAGDIVISDVIFPDDNGLDMLPRIKARRPELPVIIISAQNTLTTAVRATERGAYEYLPKPFDLDELVETVRGAVARGRDDIPASITDNDDSDSLPMIGRSPAMQEVYRLMARVMPTDLTVLILGESGTGKELVARALHDLGARKDKPFVAVNMAAIPHDLIESELFGYEKGAFTGALQRTQGRFEQAEGGTIFLDEIGDMPLDAQTRLLRVLQQGEYMLVGGRTTRKTDVRIISATNRDPQQLIDSGRFREDLYYRLNVVPIRLPPLRARREDLVDLAHFFLRQAEREGLPHKHLDGSAIEWMGQYHWPGNVRELENLMRRSAALVREDVITASALAPETAASEPYPLKVSGRGEGLADQIEQHLGRYFATFGKDLPPDGLYERLLVEVERPLLQLSLAACRGNQLRAARLLGLNRNTLRKKLNELGLEANHWRRSE